MSFKNALHFLPIVGIIGIMVKKGLLPQNIRASNIELVFSHLRQNGALSCSELSSLMGLSCAGVEKIVDDLASKGYLKLFIEKYPKVKGRRPIRYCIDETCALSIMFNFTDDSYSFLNAAGDIIFFKQLDKKPILSTLDLNAIVLDVKKELKGFDIPLKSISVALVGKAKNDFNEVIFSNKFENGLKIKDYFSDKFDAPTEVTNDTYLLLTGENATLDVLNSIYLYLGHGVSCAFSFGGKIYAGENGFAGEIGQINSALKLNSSIENGLSYENLKSLNGDILSGRVKDLSDIDKFTELLSVLTNLCFTLDVGALIIGGPLKPLNDAFMDAFNTLKTKQKFLKTTALVSSLNGVEDGLKVSALKFLHKNLK